MNRLHEESSLYLRQHASNPVDWQPWDQAALDSARESGRPILLSIGYSACHWCHVMAHESFEDETTAEVMNRLFVNIKVDREERPDLDRIYQLSHQLLTGRGGGWPLTVFLDPDELLPFFAGTYFPRERRYGMPAFREVLAAIDQWFHEHGDTRAEQGEQLRAALESIQKGKPAAPALADEQSAAELLRRGADAAMARFDTVQGGFGGAPRFPQAPLLEAVALLADEGVGTGLAQALQFTLERMARSGLRDHLDGGFFRYCVDDGWAIPHFEKMLYDNAMLLPLYAEAAARWNSPALASAAAGIAGWLQTEMQQPSGGYAASIDADADGEEGGFHVWTTEQIEACLVSPALDLFKRAYGLDQPPNFEGLSWHVQRHVDDEELQQEFGLPEAEIEAALADARLKLLEMRRSRVHPTLDNKQLTSWNALLAAGFIRAARALQREDWLDRAEGIFVFIRRELWRDGGLMAVYNAGEARFAAYLDDYAWLLDALLDYLAARWDPAWLEFAVDLAEVLLARFEDADNGGFFFSDESVDVPITRSMLYQDDATPSGNGIAVMALNRLARLLGNTRYAATAERCLSRGLPQLQESPLGHATLLRALHDALNPPPQLVLAGTDPDALAAMKQQATARHRLDCYLLGAKTDGLPGMLSEFRSERPATAWLCRGMQCMPPAHSLEELDRLMSDAEG